MKPGTWILKADQRQREYLLLLALVSTLFVPVMAQDNAEYKVKAMYLCNFTQFVKWPSDAFNGPYDPLVIGILGEDPFGDDLRNAVSSESGNERFIIIRRYPDVSEITRCHILFINGIDTVDMNHIDTLLPRYVLLVSDGEKEFLDQGGMIRFVTKKNKVHFHINRTAIKSANLEISSKMLRLAELVFDP